MGQIGKREREVEVPGPVTVPEEWPPPVLTWGRTQVHETGWRSEYARPLALVRPRILSPKLRRRMDLVLDRLGREYGIPVLRFKEAKLLAHRMAQKGR